MLPLMYCYNNYNIDIPPTPTWTNTKQHDQIWCYSSNLYKFLNLKNVFIPSHN